MESPGRAIPLISFEREGFKVNPEAVEFLSSVKEKVAVISVAGKYRTGKSFLLNRILLNIRKDGFGVGPTINPCTKGLWIWNQPIYTQTSDGQDVAAIIIDSEGLGAFDEDANHDTRIFMLALLLSSYFIYNSVGSIDENAISNLSLVVNLTKQLQVKTNESEPDVEEMAHYFPSFLWVLRDFALKLEDANGNPINSRQYLEGALKEQKGISDNIESKNRIRRLITHFFQDRDCFALIRPSEDERTLQNLNTVSENMLRPDFVTQVEALRRLVYRKLKPKTLNGNFVNGEMLAGLAKAYSEAINKGGVPTIEGAWTAVCNSECQKVASDCMVEYEKVFKSELQEPLSDEELLKLNEELYAQIIQKYRKNSIGDNASIHEEQLRKKLSERFENIKKMNDYKVKEKTEMILKPVVVKFQDKLKENNYLDINDFKRDLETEILEIRKSLPSGSSTEAKIKELTDRVTAEALEIISRHVLMEAQNNTRKLSSKVEFLEQQLESKKEEIAREKEYVKGRLEKLESDNLQLRTSQRTLELKNEELVNEKERSQQIITERYEAQLNEMKGRYKDAKTKLEEYKEKFNSLQTQYTTETSELRKDLALAKQEAEFRKNEGIELKAKRKELDAMNKESRAELRLCREDLERAENEIRKMKDQLGRGEGDSSEKNYMKVQMESLKAQLLENKSIQEALVNALQSQQPKQDKAPDANKHLLISLDKLEERNQQLESKIERLKRYQRMVKHASSLQCSLCGKYLNSTVFPAHLNICLRDSQKLTSESEQYNIVVSQTLIKEGDKPYAEYIVSITYRGKSWNVARRYKTFCDLHSALRQHYPNIELPDSSQIFNQTGSLFAAKRPVGLDQRRKAFQQYLMDLSAIPIIRESQVFRKFLGVDAQFEEDLLSPDPKAANRYGKTITPFVERDENDVDTKTGKRESFSEEEDV
jgi:hypothetical protein